MTTATRYLESRAFRAGYDAAALGMHRETSETSDWMDGWEAFHTDEARSESARYR